MASYVTTYTGDGSEIHFTATFPVLRLGDLAVVVGTTWLTLGTEYSVSGSLSGPLATLTTAPGVGVPVTLRLAVGYTPMDPASPSVQVPTLSDADTQLFKLIGDQISLIRHDIGGAPGTILDTWSALATGSTTARTLEDRFADVVNVKDFGAVCDGTTNDTAAVQAAVDYCLAVAPLARTLLVPGQCKLTSAVMIDRATDSARQEFRIISTGAGGGFKIAGATVMFDSTLAGTVCSEFVTFEGITFTGDGTSGGYVLSANKFLRMKFLGCFFNGLSLANYTSYAQTFHLLHCNVRFVPDQAFLTTAGMYDVMFSHGIVEAVGGTGGFIVNNSGQNGAKGCRFIGNLIEGVAANCFKIADPACVLWAGNYFEANGNGTTAFTINLTGGVNPTKLSATFVGNMFTATTAGTTYAVNLGQYVEEVTSVGNTVTGNGANDFRLFKGAANGGWVTSLGDGSDGVLNDVDGVGILNSANWIVGSAAAPGTLYAKQIRTDSGAGDRTLTLAGNATNGASAIGVVVENVAALTTAGSKIVSFKQGTVEKASIDKDGNYIAAAGPGVFFGAGVPGINAPAGSIYLRSDPASASTVMYVCYPANTWTAVVAP